MEDIVSEVGFGDLISEKDNKTFEKLSSEAIDEIIVEKREEESKQLDLILKCLNRGDKAGLRQLAAISGGFIKDSLRQKIWSKLIKVDVLETSPRPDTQTVESHPFYNQVLLDVNRSLKRFPPSIGESQRISMQDSLVELIMRVLIKNPDLHYYQGYHDICVTFLLIMGEEMAFYAVNKLSKSHFKVFMEETMESTADLLEMLPIILKQENRDLYEYMEKSGVGTIYSLSWIITWFSHVLNKYEEVARLFDFFIVSHHLMPLYLTVAIILYKEKQILDIDCDMASMHCYLTNIPESGELPIELLIEKAMYLTDKYKPKQMIEIQRKEKQVRVEKEKRKYGVLKYLFKSTQLFSYISRFNFFSATVVIVFCALITQYYWNV